MSQQINLFNPTFVPQRDLFSARNVAMGTSLSLLFVLIAGLLGSMLLSHREQEANAMQAQMKAAQEHLTLLAQQAASQKPSPALQAEIDSAKFVFSGRSEVLTALGTFSTSGVSSGNSFGQYLRGLARQSVNGLWLTGVVVGAGGKDVQIRGRTVDRSLVANYVERLNAEKSFAGIGFSGLQIKQGVETVPEVAAGTIAAIPKPAPYVEFELIAVPAAEPKNNAADQEKKS